MKSALEHFIVRSNSRCVIFRAGRRTKVVAPSGKTVMARFTGVLMPGWDESGCEAEPVFERPFASGLVTYTASGETVAKPFVIELVK